MANFPQFYLNNIQPYLWDVRNLDSETKIKETIQRLKDLVKLEFVSGSVTVASAGVVYVCNNVHSNSCSEGASFVFWNGCLGSGIILAFMFVNSLQLARLRLRQL